MALDLKLNEWHMGCHGIPERCLVISGKRMTICARCFGSILGHIAAFFFALFNILPAWYYSLLLVVPLLIDWSIQAFFGLMSTNFRRLVTGIFGGFGVGAIIWTLIFYFIQLIFVWLKHSII